MRRMIVTTVAVCALALAVPSATLAQDEWNHPEDVRDALRALMTNYEQMAPGSADVRLHGERVRGSLERLDARQMDVLYRAFTASPRLLAAMSRIEGTTAASDATFEIAPVGDAGFAAQADPIYSDLCLDAADRETAFAQLEMWAELALAAAAAQGECDAAPSGDDNQDNVDVCPAAATAHEAALTARFVYEQTLFCWRDSDSAEIAATLATAGEVNDALTAHDESVGQSLATLGTELSDGLTALEGQLGTHDAEIKALIEGMTSDLEELLAQALANQETILANQQTMLANQETIMMLLLTPQGRRPGWNGRPEGNNGNGNGGN